MSLCDCERGHNGLTLVDRECDCQDPTKPDDYWHGWASAFDEEPHDENGTPDWKRGRSDAQRHRAEDEKELAR